MRGTCFADGEYAKCKCLEHPTAVVMEYLGNNCEVAIYNEQKRDANETVMDKRAVMFAQQATWPTFVSPIVVLGIGVIALVLQAVFRFIDKKIAEARDHDEAIRMASQKGANAGKLNSKHALRRAGSTRSIRDLTSLTSRNDLLDEVTLAENRVSMRSFLPPFLCPLVTASWLLLMPVSLQVWAGRRRRALQLQRPALMIMVVMFLSSIECSKQYRIMM